MQMKSSQNDGAPGYIIPYDNIRSPEDDEDSGYDDGIPDESGEDEDDDSEEDEIRPPIKKGVNVSIHYPQVGVGGSKKANIAEYDDDDEDDDDEADGGNPGDDSDGAFSDHYVPSQGNHLKLAPSNKYYQGSTPLQPQIKIVKNNKDQKVNKPLVPPQQVQDDQDDEDDDDEESGELDESGEGEESGEEEREDERDGDDALFNGTLDLQKA